MKGSWRRHARYDADKVKEKSSACAVQGFMRDLHGLLGFFQYVFVTYPRPSCYLK